MFFSAFKSHILIILSRVPQIILLLSGEKQGADVNSKSDYKICNFEFYRFQILIFLLLVVARIYLPSVE